MYNWNTMVNYIARYIYIMKILKEDREKNTWFKHYINLTEIDQKLINIIVNNFNLIQKDHDY